MTRRALIAQLASRRKRAAKITYATTGRNPGAPASDLTPIALQARLLVAAARYGADPAGMVAALKAEGIATVNRVPLTVAVVRQVACRLEREGQVVIDRPAGGGWVITATTTNNEEDDDMGKKQQAKKIKRAPTKGRKATRPKLVGTPLQRAAAAQDQTIGQALIASHYGKRVAERAAAQPKRGSLVSRKQVQQLDSLVQEALAAEGIKLPALVHDVPPALAGVPTLAEVERASDAEMAKANALVAEAIPGEIDLAGPTTEEQAAMDAIKSLGHAVTGDLRKAHASPPGAGIPGKDPRIPPTGTVLRKVYKGREYRVEVGDTGYLYEGTMYPKLNPILRLITGKQAVSSLVFFGLAHPSGKAPATPRITPAQRYLDAVRALQETLGYGVAPTAAAAKGDALTKGVINNLRKIANDLERGYKGLAS